MKKEEKDFLKSEIDNLINGDLNNEELPSADIIQVEPFDGIKVSKQAEHKAKNIVISCLKLYFNENVIEKNDFMKAKAQITTANISTLYRQIKIAEHFIDKIVADVDSGNLNPRIFEVASGIQSNIVDMLKNMQMHVISMQEEYRRLQGEMPKTELMESNESVVLKDSEGKKIYTNSKALLKDLEEDEPTDD